MYELTCPSCRHVAKLKFVRVGASTPCEKCGVRFLIAAEHVRRPAPPPGHAPAVRPIPANDPDTERKRLDESGQYIGLSGLNEMMKRESSAARAPAPAPPQPAPPRRPKRSLLRSSRLMLVLLLLGVIGVLTFSGVLVWYNAHHKANARQTTRP